MRTQMAKRIWIILAILIVVAVVIFLFTGDESIEVPEELFGHWTTTDMRYANRYFEISKTNLTFGLGDNNFRIYAVSKIQGVRDNGRIVYTVNFTDDEGIEYNQSFYFYHNDKKLLKFINQAKTVWHKQYK